MIWLENITIHKSYRGRLSSMYQEGKWKINYRKRTKVFAEAMMEYLDNEAKQVKEVKNDIIKK